jgi:hypothetical protein
MSTAIALGAGVETGAGEAGAGEAGTGGTASDEDDDDSDDSDDSDASWRWLFALFLQVAGDICISIRPITRERSMTC